MNSGHGSGPTPLAQRFARHAPTLEGETQMELMRAHVFTLAKQIDTTVPEGREKSLALTHLQECLMWSNAGISGQYESLPILEVACVYDRPTESPAD
jgi:hypothetical protein